MSVQGNVVGNDGGFIGWVIAQLVALGALIASLAGYIPYAMVAAVPTIYYLLCIWEMTTVQHAVRNWRQRRLAKKYANAQAEAKKALARLDAIEVLRRAKHEARELVQHAETEAAKLVVTKTVADKKPEV